MKPSRETFGERTRTHGMTETHLYSVWCGMKCRCNNPHYKHFDRYGGRGIKVCEEWSNSFEPFMEWSFKNGYREDLSGKEQSLDRINVDGDYSPDNCRWISMKKQARNRGDTVYVESKGVKISAREFAEENGIENYVFVFRRAKAGQSADQILHDWKMINETPSEYMTVKEAAVFLGVTEQTVCNRIKSGTLDAEKIGNRFFVRRPA